MFTYVVSTVDDKIQFIKLCELSTVIITVPMEVVSLVAVYTVWTVLWV